MPFYEYQCAACGHHHEELQKVTDRVLRKCPACGRPSLKRLVSAPVFRLKGGGWYETDFKNDKEAKRNLASDKEPAADKPRDEKADTRAEAIKADDAKAAPPEPTDKKKPPPATHAAGPRSKPTPPRKKRVGRRRRL